MIQHNPPDAIEKIRKALREIWLEDPIVREYNIRYDETLIEQYNGAYSVPVTTGPLDVEAHALSRALDHLQQQMEQRSNQVVFIILDPFMD